MPFSPRNRSPTDFRAVRIKTTREWKEEIVVSDVPDRRRVFCDELLGTRRLYLFNSGKFFNSIGALAKGDETMRKAPIEKRIARLYWTCLSRAPEKAEVQRLSARSPEVGNDRYSTRTSRGRL